MAARAALDQYRQNIFPAYQTAINDDLQRFNAGFRLEAVASVNIASAPPLTTTPSSTTYSSP
ncbi:hypothetical protein [Bradyrhizobium neotropicale]|uniref:hypothetical protein n=1 Tax=Bradyrhizobium neotropicale TaxID=1497615 RepID=UPI001AD7DEFB|nr:hypothetical protein [Bradyrhizobium neotropicale]MBO4228090.1 hypothetical protein [Bradyrhizobium neotropicale]